MSKLVYGVGINDADYVVQPRINGEQSYCPIYSKWKSMLQRCYSEKFQIRRPTYTGCSTDPRWHSFMNFKAWMETQNWVGKALDKDVLFAGNKVYGPDTCVFVTMELNNFLTEADARRGDYPIGVHFEERSGKYRSTIRIGNGVCKQLGKFDTPEEAHRVWLKKKLELAKELALKQSDARVAKALIDRYSVERYI